MRNRTVIDVAREFDGEFRQMMRERFPTAEYSPTGETPNGNPEYEILAEEDVFWILLSDLGYDHEDFGDVLHITEVD